MVAVKLIQPAQKWFTPLMQMVVRYKIATGAKPAKSTCTDILTVVMKPEKTKSSRMTLMDGTQLKQNWRSQMLKFTIIVVPATKKNSMQISFKNRTVRQSEKYLQYESDCLKLITGQYKLHISAPVNIKALYFMPTHRRVDLTNLNSALHDVLVKAGVILDDNCNIVVSTDGSRVFYDKSHPRTEIEITEVDQ